MCNSMYAEHWQKISLEVLLNAGHILLFVVLNDNRFEKPNLVSKLRNYPYNHLLFRVYNRFLLKPHSKKKHSIEGLTKNANLMKCKTRQKKYSDYFFEEDIKTIKNFKADFILRFGFNILRGEILNAAQMGIWSFHHGDEQKYRGGPPGLWEIYNNDPITGVVLQKLTSKLDAGILLKKGYYRTIRHSYAAQIDHIYYHSSSWPEQYLREINNENVPLNESQTKAEIFREPSNLQMIVFWFKLGFYKVRFHLNELFIIEDWNIAFGRLDKYEAINGRLPEKLITLPKKSKKWFNADPFLFTHNQELYLLCENFSYKLGKGKINIHKINMDTFQPILTKTAIEEDFHLSYPFVFDHNNHIYCIPESFEAKQVRLYKFNPQTLTFTFERVLLDAVDAIDSTLLYHDQKWWLFFTRKDMPSVNLYLYYANDINSPFIAHPANPVVTNIKTARPAGKFFVVKGTLFRPAQDNSSTYGKRIVINKIDCLTPNRFHETEAAEIHPPRFTGKFTKGIHTINLINGYVVIDIKRFTLFLPGFVSRLKRKSIRFIKRIKRSKHDQ